MPARIIRMTGGPKRPNKAASEPGSPAAREPNMTEKFTMLGPGRTWHSASCSLNSSALIQPRSWTITRRDQASTPPKPQTAIFAKPRNSSRGVGTSRPGGNGGGGHGAASESVWFAVRRRGVENRSPRGWRLPTEPPWVYLRRRTRARPNIAHPARGPGRRNEASECSFFVNLLGLYKGCRRKPDMAINGRRNKPFGPGGSTRRLHPSPDISNSGRALGWGGGEIGSTRVVKGVFLLGMVPPLSGHLHSCERQLCSGCSGRVSGLKDRSEALAS